MAESLGGDMGLQVLQAVQVLSEQVKGLSDRMDRMEARMNVQEEWMQRLGLEFVATRGEVQQLRQEVQQVRDEVHQVRKELRAEIQAVRTELRTELRLELQAVRTEMHLGFRQMNDRIDRNNDALHLMVSGLHRTTAERFEPVEQRLLALEVR